MKKIYLFLICGLLTVPLLAITYRVNNQLTSNPSAKIYTTLQAAHDAAANGDTIMIDGSPEAYYNAIGTNVTTNLIVSNCIIRGTISLQPGSTGTFLNNIFTAASVSIPTGFVMKNNIIFTTEKTGYSLPALDAAVTYNMSISDHFGTANNNKANVTESALFVGALTASTDGKWKLKAGSPAIGAGEGGADCGAYGGQQPYILSGLPVGPTIYELGVSSYVTPDGKLHMTIKVKSY